MDQIKTGKFIADERKKRVTRRDSWRSSWESVIRRSQNGSAEMVSRRFHCCCRYVTNWIYL